MKMSVREIKREELPLIIDYFLNADVDYLKSMGADMELLPNRGKWLEKLNLEFDKPIEQKEYYYLLWLDGDKPVGHSNINHIDYGNRAKMHLHLWQGHRRKKGMGEVFLRKSIAVYFDIFQLETLVCEPYAENPAPNKLLPKVGFKFIKEYETIPGSFNFHQLVNQFMLKKGQLLVESTK